MVVAHLDEEANETIRALPEQATFELSLEEPYLAGVVTTQEDAQS